MTIYDELFIRKKNLSDYLRKFEDDSDKIKFRMIQNKSTNQYYIKHYDSENWVYIRKKNYSQIIKYAQNDYIHRLRKLAETEINAIDDFIKQSKYSQILDLSYKYYEHGIKDISFFDVNDEIYSKKWKEVEYIPKTFVEGSPEHYSKAGIRVRSKSEADICDCLDECGIPFRYECPIVVNGVLMYPDFTTLDVKKRKVIYWEHMGMLEDREYCRDAIGRIHLLQKGGISIGDNLIITVENAIHPLNRKYIMSLIEQVYDL